MNGSLSFLLILLLSSFFCVIYCLIFRYNGQPFGYLNKSPSDGRTGLPSAFKCVRGSECLGIRGVLDLLGCTKIKQQWRGSLNGTRTVLVPKTTIINKEWKWPIDGTHSSVVVLWGRSVGREREDTLEDNSPSDWGGTVIDVPNGNYSGHSLMAILFRHKMSIWGIYCHVKYVSN